jgi:hypothetical protein
LGKAADQVRASDVTLWGIIALGCWGFAVLSANLSGLLPAGVLGALHASRLEGGTINQLRSQVAEIERESQQVRRENNLLLQRFSMAEQASGEVTRRVGALEISMPRLLDQQIRGPEIDRAMTGSIVDGEVLSFEALGGSVRVEQKPLIAVDAVKPEIVGLAEGQPADALSNPDAFGLALGFPVTPADAELQWQSLTAKVGTLLLGMAPLLAAVEGSDVQQIVAGPLVSRTEAEELCNRMDRVGIPCQPAPFVGSSLPLLN